MKKFNEKNMVTAGVLGLVVVMTVALALTLNGSAFQGYLFRSAAPVNQNVVKYNPNAFKVPLKPLSVEPPQSPEPVPTNMEITRAEFAGLVAVHMKGLNMVNKTNCFTDTNGNMYENAICALYEVGLIQGDKDANGNPIKKFRPNDPVSRAEGAKMYVMAFGTNVQLPPVYSGGQYYNDVKPADWYYSSVQKLADMKIVDILPSPKSNFYPGYYLSKGRAQYMINNAITQGWAQ